MTVTLAPKMAREKIMSTGGKVAFPVVKQWNRQEAEGCLTEFKESIQFRDLGKQSSKSTDFAH